jgi:hypothetical protein
MSEDKQLNDKFAQVLKSNEVDNAFATLSKFMQANELNGLVKFNFTNLESKKKYKVTIERID